MIRCDALVVGGGPAGSTCARIIRKAGWAVIVADRARFPRDKNLEDAFVKIIGTDVGLA